MSWAVPPAVGRPLPFHPFREPVYRPLTEAEKEQCRSALAYRGYTRERLAKAFQVPLRDIHEALGEECLRCSDYDAASARVDARIDAVKRYLHLGCYVAVITSAVHGLWRWLQ